jgi:hypothetical protein
MDELGREPLVISCGDCAMRCTTACQECVVTFLLDPPEAALELDGDQARVVHLLANAGMIPELRYREAV